MDNPTTEAAPVAPTETTPADGGNQPHNATTQAPEAPVISSEQDAFNAVSGLSVQELESILSSDGSESSTPSSTPPKTEEKPPETPPTEEPPQQQEGKQPPAPTQAAPEPEGATDDDEDEPLPKNWRITANDDADARVFKLRKQEPGISLGEAMRRTGHPDATQAAENTSTQNTETAAPPADPFQAELEEIKSLEQKILEHDEAYETQEASKLRDVRLSKLLELQEKRHQARLDALEREHAQSRTKPFIDQAVAKHPNLARPGTTQFVVMQALVKQHEGSPILQRPDFAIKLLEIAEKQHPDVFPKATTPPPVAPPATTPSPQAPPARPVGQVVSGAQGSQGVTTPAEAEQALEGLSFDEMLAVADLVGDKNAR